MEEELEEVHNQKMDNFERSLKNGIKNEVNEYLQKALGNNFQDGKYSVDPRLIGNIKSKLNLSSCDEELKFKEFPKPKGTNRMDTHKKKPPIKKKGKKSDMKTGIPGLEF